MRQDEFKAWFEGYCEGMGYETPNTKQWARLKEMVSKLDNSIPERGLCYSYNPVTGITSPDLPKEFLTEISTNNLSD